MKKLICLLFLAMWAYLNPDQFVKFWGPLLGTGMALIRNIFHLALKTFEQSA